MRNDNRHVTVTCSYYAHFMVKEKDDPGLKGAESIAIVAVQHGHLSQCVAGMRPGEKEFKEWVEEGQAQVMWNGYFAGVKRDLIFLERPDGDDGGIPFAVFKPDTESKVFRDTVMLRDGGKREINFLTTSNNQITIRYLRVANASCSVPKSGETCWSKLQQQTGLVHTPMPKCSDYEGKEAGTAASVIAYPVEVSLFPKPSIRPMGDPIRSLSDGVTAYAHGIAS